MLILENTTEANDDPVAYQQGISYCTDREAWAKKVKAELQKQPNSSLPPELRKKVFELPASRLNSPSNRSYFVRTIAEYVLRKQRRLEEWSAQEHLIVQLAFCSEIMITVQYYHNFIFDGKSGVNTPLLTRETLLKANLLKSWLFQYIESAFAPNDLNKVVFRQVNDAFDLTDIGQFIEGRYNSYDYYKSQELDNEFINYYLLQNKNVDWEIINDCIDIVKEYSSFSNFEQFFLKLYFLRLYLISTALYETYSNLLANIFRCDDSETKLLKQFSASYGIMMQIVNDNNDFVPGYMDQDTKSKYPQDQQSDIRNKNITLPLFLFLHFNKNKKSNILSSLDSIQNKSYSERREKLIFEEILSVLLQYTIPIGKRIAAKGIFRVNNDKPLAALAEIANDNRFYKIIFR